MNPPQPVMAFPEICAGWVLQPRLTWSLSLEYNVLRLHKGRGFQAILRRTGAILRDEEVHMAKSGLEYGRVSLSVRYKTVFFPVDTLRFAVTLREAGFILPDRLEQAVLASPLGARVEPSGLVARRGDIAIGTNPDRLVLMVHAPDPQEAATEMDSLESILRDRYAVDSPALAMFYELLTEATVKAGRNPLQSWISHLGQVRFLGEASHIVGQDVAPYGLRLVPAGQIPDQADWFDIRVEPRVLAPAEYHSLSIVFRNAVRETVFDFARNLDQTLDRLVSLVEEGQPEP